MDFSSLKNIFLELKKNFKIKVVSQIKDFSVNLEKFGFDLKFIAIFILSIFNLFIISSNIELFFKKNMSNLSIDSSFYGYLVGIIIPLFVFATVEGWRDKNEKYKMKVLLNEGKLPSLVLLLILGIIFISIIPSKIFQSSIVLVFCLFTAYSFYKIMKVLTSNKIHFLKYYKDIFKRNFNSAIRYLIKIRKDNEKILKFHENSNDITLFEDFEENKIDLKSKKEGTINEIKLDEIKNLIENIKESRGERIDNNNRGEMPRLDNKKPNKTNKPFIIFNLNYGDKITLDTVLLTIKGKGKEEEKKIQQQLEEQINNAISINKNPTYLDEIEYDMDDYKNKIEGVITEELFGFNDFFEIYYDLARLFLDTIKKGYGRYGYEEAKKETHSIKFQKTHVWSPFDWLKNHVMVFFKKSCRLEEDTLIYSSLQWFSYRLANLSIEEDEHLLFQEGLILWLRQLNFLCEKLIDLSDDKKALEKINEHIKYFRRHIIRLVFKNTLNGEQRIVDDGYAVYILETIKRAFEIMLENKLEIPNELQKILKKLKNDFSYNDGDSLFHNSAFNDFKSYQSRRLQFLFGLGSYLEGIDLKPDIKKKTTNISSIIEEYLFSSCLTAEQSLEIYRIMRDNEVSNFWHWSFFNERPNQGVRISHYPNNIRTYFLKIILEKSNELDGLEIQELNPSTLQSIHDIACISNEESLKKIEGNSTDTDRKKVLQFFSKVYNHKEEIIRNKIIKAELSKDIITLFKESLKEEFKTIAYVRTVFEIDQNVKNIQKPNFAVINYVLNKGWFVPRIKENIMNYDQKDLARNYAEAFAKGENKFLTNEIIKKCEKKKPISYANLVNVLENSANKKIMLSQKVMSRIYRDRGTNGDIKIIYDYNYRERGFDKDKLKIKDKDILFCKIYNRGTTGQENDIIIFNANKLPKIEIPNKKEGDSLFDFDFLEEVGMSVAIEDLNYNEALRQHLLNKPPEWLKEKGDDKEQQKAYLNELVNIKIIRNIGLNFQHDELIGEVFTLKDEDTDES